MPPAVSPVHLDVLLRVPCPHPLSVVRAVLALTGDPMWLSWAPRPLRVTLESLAGAPLPDATWNIVMATQTVISRDDFWRRWEHFHAICESLNGRPPAMDHLQHPTVGEMMVAVDGAMLARMEMHIGVPTYSEEVARYVAAQALHQDVWVLPEPLHFAAPYATKRYYHCNDCGYEAEAFHHDGLCDVCTDRLEGHHLANWDPNAALVEKGRGRNIVWHEKNPGSAVWLEMEKLANQPKYELPETRAGIGAARVLLALNFLQLRREQAGRGLHFEHALTPSPTPMLPKTAALNPRAVRAGASILQRAGGTLQSAGKSLKGWWAEEAPTLGNMLHSPVKALRHGMEHITAPITGLGDGAMRTLGVGGTLYGASIDAAAKDPSTGEQRGTFQRGLSTAGGLYASVAGWPSGAIIGMATGAAGSLGGDALGKWMDSRRAGAAPTAPQPLPAVGVAPTTPAALPAPAAAPMPAPAPAAPAPVQAPPVGPAYRPLPAPGQPPTQGST